jgi:hypothetical protein
MIENRFELMQAAHRFAEANLNMNEPHERGKALHAAFDALGIYGGTNFEEFSQRAEGHRMACRALINAELAEDPKKEKP